MKKLKLDLDQIQVVSFESEKPGPGVGTVLSASQSNHLTDCDSYCASWHLGCPDEQASRDYPC
jgi:hypothetical protein